MSIQIVRPKRNLKIKIHQIRHKLSLRYKFHKLKHKILLKRYEKLHLKTVRNEFRLNQFITLKLIDYGNGHTCTFIIINDIRFSLYDFSFEKIFEILNEKRNYSCMDEACMNFIGTHNAKDFMEDPDTMFWIYCYYIDAWVQCNYDWRMLKMDDAFPILHALYRAGDPKAKEVFKVEIIKALLSGYLPAVYYMMSRHSLDACLLDFFKFEEIIWLFEKLLVGFHNRNELKMNIFYYLRERGIEYYDNGTKYDNEGFKYYDSDSFKKSIKYLNEALKICPGDLPTLQKLGEVYLKNGNLKLARDLLIYVIDRFSSNDIITDNYRVQEAWVCLGESYNRLFLFNKAILAYKKSMDLHCFANTWDKISIAYEGLGDFKSAKDAKKSFKKREKRIIKIEKERVQW